MKITKNQLRRIIQEELAIVRSKLIEGGRQASHRTRAQGPYKVKGARRKLATKTLGKIATGPVGAAITGAEVAGHAIDMGVGGIDAKIGKASMAPGSGGEEDAYVLWAQDRLDTEGKASPTYSEYKKIEKAGNTDKYRAKKGKARRNRYGTAVQDTAAAMQDRGVDFDAQNK